MKRVYFLLSEWEFKSERVYGESQDNPHSNLSLQIQYKNKVLSILTNTANFKEKWSEEVPSSSLYCE